MYMAAAVPQYNSYMYTYMYMYVYMYIVCIMQHTYN